MTGMTGARAFVTTINPFQPGRWLRSTMAIWIRLRPRGHHFSRRAQVFVFTIDLDVIRTAIRSSVAPQMAKSSSGSTLADKGDRRPLCRVPSCGSGTTQQAGGQSAADQTQHTFVRDPTERQT